MEAQVACLARAGVALEVPRGQWMSARDACSAILTAAVCEAYNSTSPSVLHRCAVFPSSSAAAPRGAAACGTADAHCMPEKLPGELDSGHPESGHADSEDPKSEDPDSRDPETGDTGTGIYRAIPLKAGSQTGDTATH